MEWQNSSLAINSTTGLSGGMKSSALFKFSDQTHEAYGKDIEDKLYGAGLGKVKPNTHRC